MKSLRQRISLLRNKISDTLSDDNDLFGYIGISKPIIIDSLSESYELLAILENYNSKFETIFAKREVASYIDKAHKYLSEIYPTGEAKDKFNEFLFHISKIRYSLKDAYISLTENPVRVDFELIKAKSDLSELTKNLDEINTVKSQIDEIQNKSITFIHELESKHTLALENDKKINEFVENIESINKELAGTNEKINIWKPEIQTIKEDISNKQVDVIKLKTEVEQILEKSKWSQKQIEKSQEELNEQHTVNRSQQNYIQQTIEDVSRAGMAGSFKKRKDELKRTQLIWAFLTVISVGGLVVLSYFLVKPIIGAQKFDIDQLFIKLPVFVSAVWLGWFCSKQYGFTSRIREDYSYKYAISMAFEGYKNETREIDEELLQKLIELTIFNVSKNPISIFDSKSNHGTPYNEMFDNLVKQFFGEKREKKENAEKINETP